MHGRAVERRRRHRVETEAVADRRRLGGAALLLEVRGEDMDRLFLGAGDGDGDAVEHQPPRGVDRGRAEIGIAGGGNLLAQLRRHRHDFAATGSRRSEHVGIDDVDRMAAAPGGDLVENFGELKLVFLARHVTDVRHANNVRHIQQRMVRVAHRLLFIDVDRGHTRDVRP